MSLYPISEGVWELECDRCKHSEVVYGWAKEITAEFKEVGGRVMFLGVGKFGHYCPKCNGVEEIKKADVPF